MCKITHRVVILRDNMDAIVEKKKRAYTVFGLKSNLTFICTMYLITLVQSLLTSKLIKNQNEENGSLKNQQQQNLRTVLGLSWQGSRGRTAEK